MKKTGPGALSPAALAKATAANGNGSGAGGAAGTAATAAAAAAATVVSKERTSFENVEGDDEDSEADGALRTKASKGLDFEFDELFLTNNVEIGESEAGSPPDAGADAFLAYEAEDTVEEELPERDEHGDFSLNFQQRHRRVGLDDFELQCMLGKGAYGKVVLVREKESGELYAMKILRKDFLLRSNNVTYTRTERDILRHVRHPFVVSLRFAFQTRGKVYLVMDFCHGGEMMFHLRKETMFSEEVVRFYAGEIVLALEHLHSLGIIHRDLKPENILLDIEGHVCLTDFGLAKEHMDGPDARTKTFCGTVEYMAPEMIAGGGYTRTADWWSVGILIYDMLTGNPPFTHKHQPSLEKKILHDKLKLPPYLTKEATGIIRALLNRDVKKRLGSGPRGVEEIKRHAWFKGLRWDKLLNRELRPPFRPEFKSDSVVNNFDKALVIQRDKAQLDSPHEVSLSNSQEDLFKGFSYCRTPPVAAARSASRAQLGSSAGSGSESGSKSDESSK